MTSKIAKDVVLNNGLNCSAHLLEYYSIYQHYLNKYGNKIVVVMQKGTFYEIYQYCPSDDGLNYASDNDTGLLAYKLDILQNNEEINNTINFKKDIGNAIEISKVIHFKLTSCSTKECHSIKNPYMLGIPKNKYFDKRDILLLNGYKIIRIDEIDNTNPVKRQIGEFSSPTTELDIVSYNPKNTNNIVCIYIEFAYNKKNINKTSIICGISCIDNTTGENSVYEVFSKDNDENYAIQEIYRFLSCKRPIEIIIYLNQFPNNLLNDYKKEYINKLELNNYSNYQFYYNVENKYENIQYQETFLLQVFKQLTDSTIIHHTQKLNTIIDKLNLSHMNYGRISYILLIYYIYEQNSNLIINLPLPNVDWLDKHNSLILTNNCIQQLNLYNNDDFKSKENITLINILDNTITPMGSRFLKNRLLNPITSIDTLNLNYNLTEELINNEVEQLEISNKLKKLKYIDIERLQRMISINSISPSDISKLIDGYNLVIEIYNYINNNNNLKIFKNILIDSLNFDKIVSVINFINMYVDNNLLKLAKNNNKYFTVQNVFIKEHGYYTEYDKLYKTWFYYYDYLLKFIDYIKTQYNKGDDDIKLVIDSTTKGTVVQIIVKDSFANLINKNKDKINCDIQFQSKTSKEKIVINQALEKCYNDFPTIHRNMELQLSFIFQHIIECIKTLNFNLISSFINTIDFTYSNAITAIKNVYYKPTINSQSKISYLNAKDLRHPLIEKIISNKYISNDIELGSILLYAINSAGKSSLLKAIGINIIMAQAGLFTPSKLTYYPYNKILTRLSGNDDILKGKSSFIVEMEELGIILRDADENSLVLIDELSKGSEHDSAISLTISTINELIKRQSSFIITSHLHELINLLNDINIQIKHLSVKYNEKDDELIYDRKLKDGGIDSLYGIEVAKYMNLPKDFINNALKIRSKLVDDKFNIKGSKYNNKVYKTECFLCGDKNDLHTHHIEEQNLADKNGKIGYYDKNIASNLLILCEKCHENLHKNGNNLSIIETLKGMKINKI